MFFHYHDWPRPRGDRQTEQVSGEQLAGAVTIIRLSLHVLSAAVWVGGQITIAGLVPTARSLGDDAAKKLAQAFGRLQWPAYVVLLATGVWNVFVAHPDHSSTAWRIVLWVKIAVVLIAGLAAYLHQNSRTKAGLAIGGAVAALASLAALVLGVALAG
jgi:putative copper export protein